MSLTSIPSIPSPPMAQIAYSNGQLTPMWQAWFSQLQAYVNAINNSSGGGGGSGDAYPQALGYADI